MVTMSMRSLVYMTKTSSDSLSILRDNTDEAKEVTRIQKGRKV